jgi:hypothetical protein
MKRLAVAVLACGLLLSGCADLRIRLGTQPNLDALERELAIGTSTEADVHRALGQPYARGRSLLPIDQAAKPLTVWTYYYETGGLKDPRRTFLFVYLDENHYQGYMWFSSLTGQPDLAR